MSIDIKLNILKETEDGRDGKDISMKFNMKRSVLRSKLELADYIWMSSNSISSVNTIASVFYLTNVPLAVNSEECDF